jgi:tRNA A37 threonylcarbamoyladenosine synthetase subunit TsaC/SUA5/YrdC
MQIVSTEYHALRSFISKVLQSDNPVILFEFTTVYGLISPINHSGVAALNRTKSRLPDKFYGSVSSDPTQIADLTTDVNKLNGFFLRYPVHDHLEEAPVIGFNKHQTLFETQQIRKTLQIVEEEMKSLGIHDTYLNEKFSGVLCTSANISGHPQGSITSFQQAQLFGAGHNVPLMIVQENVLEKGGSFPVFEWINNQIICHRGGTNQLELAKKLEEIYLSS